MRARGGGRGGRAPCLAVDGAVAAAAGQALAEVDVPHRPRRPEVAAVHGPALGRRDERRVVFLPPRAAANPRTPPPVKAGRESGGGDWGRGGGWRIT